MVTRKQDLNVQVEGEPKDENELDEMCDEICLNTGNNWRNLLLDVYKFIL